MDKNTLFSHFENKLDQSVNTALIENAIHYHPMFKKEFIGIRINSIKNYLRQTDLENIARATLTKTISINLADSIPFENVMLVTVLLIMGHSLYYQVPGENDQLIQKFFEALETLKPGIAKELHFISHPAPKSDFYISDRDFSQPTASTYFSQKLLPKKKTASIAILNGNESRDELKLLASDIALYFGMGKGNIKKVIVPQGYSLNALFESLEPYSFFKDNHHYFNHFQYQYSLCQLKQEPFLENNFIILKQDSKNIAPVGMVYFDFYTAEQKINFNFPDIYRVYSANSWYPGALPFGSAMDQCLEPDDEMTNWIKRINE